MFTLLNTFRSPSILSVQVKVVLAGLVFVVTSRPAVAGAVGECLRQANPSLSVIWLPSVASAHRRLEYDRAALIIVDDLGETTEVAIAGFRAAAPTARVLNLSENLVQF